MIVSFDRPQSSCPVLRPLGVMLCTLPLHFLRCFFSYYQIQSKLNFVSIFFGYLSSFWNSLDRQPCVLREILRSPMAQVLNHAAQHLSLYEKSEFFQLLKAKSQLPVKPGCLQNTVLVLTICYMYFPRIQDFNNAMCKLVILFFFCSVYRNFFAVFYLNRLLLDFSVSLTAICIFAYRLYK